MTVFSYGSAIKKMIYYTHFFMKKFFLVLLVVCLFTPSVLDASMTGGTYEIYADSIGVSEANVSTSTSYTLFDTTGESYATSTAGGTYVAKGGFQALEKGILRMIISENALDFGTLSSSAVTTRNIQVLVDTDSFTGYTASVTEDGNLRSGANDIDDVSDGEVTIGSEEYGITTSGGDGLLSADTAISGQLAVASKLGQVSGRQTQVQFKASVTDATPAGTYGHTVIFTVTVNP